MQAMFLFLLIVAIVSSFGTTWEISPHDEDIGIRVGDPVTYTAGVFEFEPYCEWTAEGGQNIVRENANLISQYAADAKEQGVDILVSAEYSIQSLDMHTENKTALNSLLQFVPDPDLNVTPCSLMLESDNVEAVQILSCTAMDNEMYLVVDLGETSPCSPDAMNPFKNALDTSRECPKSGYIHYNTQVVFDRDGMVIARYRKKNLFLEWQFMPGLEPNEDALFTTDFGVTFSLQVCFDIAYFNPGVSNVVEHGIKDIVMSTAWVDMLPYHIAPAVQNGFSRGLGANLMVSGYHRPERAKMGSGIYRGASDLANTYIFDTESGSQLLVSKVNSVATVDVKLYNAVKHQKKASSKSKTAVKTTPKHSPNSLKREHTIYYDDLSNYTHVYLTQGESEEAQHAEVCHMDGLCCQLTYYPTSHLNYSLLAYSGPVIKGFGEYSVYAQVCSVLWCHTSDVNTCTNLDFGIPESDSFGPFVLTGSFNTDYVYPIVFNRDLQLVDNQDYEATTQVGVNTIKTSSQIKDLMTAGLYGRCYERDP